MKERLTIKANQVCSTQLAQLHRLIQRAEGSASIVLASQTYHAQYHLTNWPPVRGYKHRYSRKASTASTPQLSSRVSARTNTLYAHPFHPPRLDIPYTRRQDTRPRGQRQIGPFPAFQIAYGHDPNKASIRTCSACSKRVPGRGSKDQSKPRAISNHGHPTRRLVIAVMTQYAWLYLLAQCTQYIQHSYHGSLPCE